MLKKTLLILFISTLLYSCMCAAEKIEEANAVIQEEYPFLNMQADTIIDADCLSGFFVKLAALEKGEKRVLNIVHIGDSHVQADFGAQEVRSLFQQQFGNAGRGLVMPLRLGKTNEASTLRSSSENEWQYTSIISRNSIAEPGIAAAVLQTSDSAAAFNLLVRNTDVLDNSFTKAVFILPSDNPDFQVSDTSSNEPYFVSNSGSLTFPVPFSRPTNSLRLTVLQPDSLRSQFSLGGIILENEQAGIRYHSIGINGARYRNYNAAPQFFEQLPLLNPDLIIIALGTNEASARDITADEVYYQASTMINRIRGKVGEVPVVVVVPVHDYYRRKYFNPYLKFVRKGLLEAASTTRSAVLDLHEVGGGYGSCQKWKATQLLHKDGVHFTVKGYKLQGNMLFNALMDSYQKYGAR